MSDKVLAPNLTAAQMSAVIADPMLACPEALRPPLWQVWVCHQHLFPTPLPLAGSMGRWVRESGLREDDAQKILRRALTPEAMRNFRFAADLLTFLAESAKELVDRRKAADETVRRREPGTVGRTAKAAGLEDAFRMPGAAP